jgi:cellulose synthase/poly-beta-1,6-N-acetylglucosamine synthase-like glycosyltransferase
MKRRIAVVVPARDESERIEGCLKAVTELERDERVQALTVLVLANNCHDDTAERAGAFALRCKSDVVVKAATLEPARANAGWARRLAFDAGADYLADPQDLLMCTDADTRMAGDWLLKTLDHIDAGFDAVAGHARLDPRELRKLDPAHRRRLAAIRRYEDAFYYLKSLAPSGEPSPRHFYEGGVSLALTLEAYREIGGAPTPRVGEDKALCAALRQRGRRIRHPKDVRVLTSCRIDGRAPEGAADTLSRWVDQGMEDSLWGIEPVAAALGGTSAHHEPMTFARLPSETEKARALVNAMRRRRLFDKAG